VLAGGNAAGTFGMNLQDVANLDAADVLMADLGALRQYTITSEQSTKEVRAAVVASPPRGHATQAGRFAAQGTLQHGPSYTALIVADDLGVVPMPGDQIKFDENTFYKLTGAAFKPAGGGLWQMEAVLLK
jgi:hypothetical protein